MQILNDAHDLLSALNHIGPDPNGAYAIDALRARGYTFSPALERQIAAARPRQRVPIEQRKAALRSRGGVPMPPIVVAAPRRAAAQVFALPAGGYHTVIALGTSVLSEALAGLYLNGVWPRTLDVPTLGSFTITLLRSLFTGVPDGGDIAIASLRFEAAATVHALPAGRWPILHVPFAVDLVRTTTRAVVATLSATVRLGIGIDVVTDQRTITLFVGNIPELPGPNDEEKLHLDVNPTSQLQFRDGAKRELVDYVLNNVFHIWLERNVQRFAISPKLDNPFGGDLNVPLPHIDVCASVVGGAEVMMVGMQFGGTPPDPAQLSFPGFEGDENVYACSSEALLKMGVDIAYQSGALQALIDRAARDKGVTFRLGSADADLKPGQVDLIVDGALVDYCKFDKDLGITITRTEKISIEDGKIRVEESDSASLDGWDAFFCIILAGIELLIPGWQFVAIWRDIDWLIDFVHAGLPGGTVVTYYSGVFSAVDPLPGTERIARVAARRLPISDDLLEAFGHAEFQQDSAHTFLYVSFVDAAGSPIRGARVQAMDMDNPAPAGDDVNPPKSTPKRVVYSGAKRRVTTASTYTPNADQTLGTATTDDQGRAVFRLASLSTTAGKLVKTTMTEYLDRQGGHPRRPGDERPDLPEVDVQTETDMIPEANPDLYFRITLPGGRVADTKRLPSGLLVNFSQPRLGAYDAPVVFRIS